MVRIFMPKLDPKDVAQLKGNEAFLMHARVPYGAKLLGSCSVPSLVDMMGFSGGGGVPAYAFYIGPEEDRLNDVAFLLLVPEAPWVPQEGIFEKALEPVKVMGMLLVPLMLTGSHVGRYLEQVRSSPNGFVLESVPYKVPDYLKAATVHQHVYQKAQQDAVAKKLLDGNG